MTRLTRPIASGVYISHIFPLYHCIGGRVGDVYTSDVLTSQASRNLWIFWGSAQCCGKVIAAATPCCRDNGQELSKGNRRRIRKRPTRMQHVLRPLSAAQPVTPSPERWSG